MIKGRNIRNKIVDAADPTKIKRATIASVYVTALIVSLLSIILIIALCVNHFSGPQKVIGGSADGEGVFTLSYGDTKKGDLLVINKSSTAFDFSSNPEASLVSMSSEIPTADGTYLYTLRNTEMKASRAALTALNKMIEDFYAQSENKAAAAELYIWSAYRSLDTQNSLGTATKGGHSDFHTGSLFELTYSGTATSISQNNAYDWLYKNAHKYGFIMRYPEAKSSITGVSDFDNAFRYVGIAHATYMLENDLCLEEYVQRLRSYNEENPLTITAEGSTYSVYYVKADADVNTTIVTPSKNGTTISGDNAGGFIVTVKK